MILWTATDQHVAGRLPIHNICLSKLTNDWNCLLSRYDNTPQKQPHDNRQRVSKFSTGNVAQHLLQQLPATLFTGVTPSHESKREKIFKKKKETNFLKKCILFVNTKKIRV